ncbi:testis-expressed protein 47-like isoform X2 [Sceloporus undulatus]|uniref:testis-expressed protein 47-like isoform X2 n=1 Tax=Sceloporus undulatus TaxID=8520 RepID=UPI001C4D30B6|nr:testis-expressed protein 47-like isoform X2 [Sceloporus undulatus]
MSALNVGISPMGNHDEKFTKMWGRQENSPSEEEEERVNFLDQLLQKKTHNGKDRKSLLHRLVFLAKISPDLADKRDLAEYWEQLFVNLQRSSYQGEGITGLLLLYPTCIVHILESSSDVLYSILRDLRDMEEQQRALVLDAKILIMSHKIPSRLFQQWHYKVLRVSERHLDYDTSQEDSAETLTHECLTVLLKLGKHLLQHPKSPKNLPDTILEKVPELIVHQNTICYLLACHELLSPAQYLQLFDFPVNLQMDSVVISGNVWIIEVQQSEFLPLIGRF